MSDVAKDVGYDIVKKPIVIVGSVIIIGGIAYFFLSDTALGQLVGLGVDAIGYAVDGINWYLDEIFFPIFENVTLPVLEWITDPQSYADIGNFIVDDVGGFFSNDIPEFFEDDVGGAFTDAGNAVGDFFEDDVGDAFSDAGSEIRGWFKF